MSRQVWWAMAAGAVAAAAWFLCGSEPLPAPVSTSPPAATRTATSPEPSAIAVGRAPDSLADMAPTPGVATPDDYQELQDDRWLELQRAVAAGQLDAVLLRGQQRVAGARVRLWSQSGSGTLLPWDEAAPASLEARTDVEGRATFPGLPAGTWTVRADDGDDHVFRTDIATNATEPSHAVVLVLGRASIDGRVGDAGGAPRVDAQVQVRGIGPLPQRGATARSDRDGRFHVGGLAAGRYWVRVLRGPDAVNEEQRMVTLQSGQRATMLFGRAVPLLTWTGRITDGDGEAIPGVRRVWLRHADGSDERALVSDPSGAFAIELPAGDWQLSPGGSLFPGASFASVAVGDRGLQQDVVWPGIRVVGELRPDEPAQFDAVRAAADLRLLGNGEQQLSPEGPFATAAGSIVQWLQVAPGSYRVSGMATTAISSPPGGVVDVQVPATARACRVVLFLRQRR